MSRDYYAAKAVSRSLMEDARVSMPLAHARHITRELERADTPAMLLGRATHCAILEGSEWPDRYIVAPPDLDRRTKSGKATWAEMQEDGREILTATQMAQIEAMTEACAQHPVAYALLWEGGESEVDVRWERDGVPCKALLDRVDAVRNVVVDLKTCADPSPAAFARACASGGYHRQAAWYCDAYAATFGEPPRYALVAVRSAPPWEVAVYELHPEDIQVGRHEYDLIWPRVRDAWESGEWASPWQSGAQVLRLPGWIGADGGYLL